MAMYKVVACDHCGETDAFSFNSEAAIRKIKRKQGWSFGKRDLCPKCKHLARERK